MNIKNLMKHVNVKNVSIGVGVVCLLGVINFGVGYYSKGYDLGYEHYAKSDEYCNNIVVSLLPPSKSKFIVKEILDRETEELKRYHDWEMNKKDVTMFEKLKMNIVFEGGLDGMEDFYKECFKVD